jgi:hypothetical protein
MKIKIQIETTSDALSLLNQWLNMAQNLNFQACNTEQKTMLSLVFRLRTKLMLKEINKSDKKDGVKLKLEYYEASALYYYLNNFSRFFALDQYQNNMIEIIRGQLHQKLQ